MNRLELEKKVIEIVSRYTYVVVTLDLDIRDDLGLDSMDEADMEKDIESEFNFYEDWIACDVFGVKDIHEKFSKNAYYARLLVARSLSNEGFRNKVIAKKMGLSERTVRRLVKMDEGKIFEDAKYAELSKEFIKMYFNDKEYKKDIA